MTTLEQRLARLPREMPPSTDLWPAISARLDPPQRRWTLPRMAAAAGVFLLAAAALRLGSEMPRVQGPGGNLQVLSASAELEYSGALRELRNSVASLSPHQEAPALREYQDSLEVVHQATEQVRAALRRDPDSQLLNQMLAELQKKQLSVLRDMALASGAGDRRAT